MRTIYWIAALAAGVSALALENDSTSAPLSLMPQVNDYTHMWWADGFPSRASVPRWLRCIQTGHYALVLDTQTLTIPHFGPLDSELSYAACAQDDDRRWQNLPPAELGLSITVDGTVYRCTQGGEWSQFRGPRLIESGRFLQRADVTDLIFVADEATQLNVEARLETVAWPSRLGLVLAARPGNQPIVAGEESFGRIGGGFGLDGSNHLEIPHNPEIDPQQFTLAFWVFVPTDYQVSKRTGPWLVCKNRHEETDGNFGLVILGGRPQARLNIGGGRENMFIARARHSLALEAWNHLAMSYDGDSLQIYVNGNRSGECKIGRTRVPGHQGLAFGRRQDNGGDGYHFRGVVDEIQLYDRALTAAEIRADFKNGGSENPAIQPVRQWDFRHDGIESAGRPRERWTDATMEISLSSQKRTLRQRGTLAPDQARPRPAAEWQEVFLAIDPVNFRLEDNQHDESVRAESLPDRVRRPVASDTARGWHRVNLDGISPVQPPNKKYSANDAIERVRLVLANPTDRERVARLLLEKTGGGFRQRLGSAITGISAILRDSAGHPIGIPVQLSKNWHNRPEGGVHAGTWFHGFTQVRLPPNALVELELAIVYGHWGGVAAASHSQLCLIGWGSNQLWNQSAMGSWGESICFEPDQVQGDCSILDVRPVMVRSMNNNLPWSWTHNVGGGDYLRLFDSSGQRMRHAGMRTAYQSQGPCLTDVIFAGRIDDCMEHCVAVSLARTDDVVRATYRLRCDINKPVDFSRFVIFQIGADTYSYTGERKMAIGNESGLTREWATQWGGDIYRTDPIECSGRIPWVSLHEGVPRSDHAAASPGATDASGAWANRCLVIRSWNARLGGRSTRPWIAEHGVRARGEDTSTVDVMPPPGVTRLEPGDFVEATIEHIILPQFADDYYGPNQSLRIALGNWSNSWQMALREAAGNDRHVDMLIGTLARRYPDIRVRTVDGTAKFILTGGLGYVPLTFTHLNSPLGNALQIDGQPLDQSVHGNDYWQVDYDPVSQRWSRTYNIPARETDSQTVELLVE